MKPYKKAPPPLRDMSAYEGPPFFWKPLKPEVGSDDEFLSSGEEENEDEKKSDEQGESG